MDLLFSYCLLWFVSILIRYAWISVYLSVSFYYLCVRVFMHLCNISSMRHKRVERTTRNGVFFAHFEVFHLLMKHSVECLILLLQRNDFRERN